MLKSYKDIDSRGLEISQNGRKAVVSTSHEGLYIAMGGEFFIFPVDDWDHFKWEKEVSAMLHAYIDGEEFEAPKGVSRTRMADHLTFGEIAVLMGLEKPHKSL